MKVNFKRQIVEQSFSAMSKAEHALQELVDTAQMDLDVTPDQLVIMQKEAMLSCSGALAMALGIDIAGVPLVDA